MKFVKPSAAPDVNFPPLTLTPVVNSRHAWVALALHAPAGREKDCLAALPRIFGELGLGAALSELDAIVPLDPSENVGAELGATLPAAKIILRLPLRQCIDPGQQAGLQLLRQSGFRLMLDGLPPAAPPLAPALTAVASAEMAPLEALSRLPGPHLACAVDSLDRFELCHRTGYAWFAGDYPLHPRPVQRQQQGSSRSLLLRLLAMVTSDADSRDIEALLKQDPSLSYHLLKLVNSVSFSLTTTITSFSYAITLLGRRQLQRWLQLLLYAQQRHGDEASPLLARAARRANMMESLCAAVGGDKEAQEQAFMTGMFSLLDALFSMPLEKIVTPLHLGDDIEAGLISRGGRLGRLLFLVEQSERPATPRLGGELEALQLAPVDYLRAQIGACAWAIQVSRDA